MATLVSHITDLATAIRNKLNLMTPRLIPAGGILGQVLAKTSSTDYAVAWGNRTVILTGTTDTNGLATITFSPAFTNVPFVTGQCNQASTANPVRMTSVEVLDLTKTGCIIKTMRHAVTGVLLLNTQVPGAEPSPSTSYQLFVYGT